MGPMPNKQLRYKPYLDQLEAWPEKSRALVLQYDAESVVLYDSSRISFANKSVDQQQILMRGSDPTKPIWLKLGFLYTMARSNWGSREGQERTVAYWAVRPQFEEWLNQAVHTKYFSTVYESQEVWQQANLSADVLIEWSPDHRPNGSKTARRTLQLGLRRSALEALNAEGLLHVADVSSYVKEQADFLRDYDSDLLLLPYERLYPIKDPQIKARLGLDS